MTRLVVVGGDAAGMSAASQAKRLSPDLEILAFECGNYVSYSACGEPYVVGGEVTAIDRLLARTPAQFASRGIEVHLRTAVVEIDLDRRTVVVDAAGERRKVGFDLLMYSTGASPARPSTIAGPERAHVLRSLDDAARLREVVDGGVRRAAVVGGGYIGLEAGEALSHRGVNVSLLTRGPHVLTKTFDPDLGERANAAVRRMGIDLQLLSPVEAIGRDSVFTADREVPADLVVLGVGTVPEARLAAESGIALGESGAVAVNSFQETSVEGVWAAGDCAEATHRVSGLQVNIALGTIANKAGRIAGTNIGAYINGTKKVAFAGVLGTAITKVGEVEIARTGLTTRQAEECGLPTVFGSVTGTNTSGYWPHAARVDLKVIAEKGSGRILGGQVVGGPSSGKKIDVIVAAIWAGLAVEELEWVDLAYAPPFGGTWDVINIAGRRAGES